MPNSTDQMTELLDAVPARKASTLTVQDLIRHALASGVKLSELTEFGVQLR